ncbi:MAG: S24 family peptidase, partial [Bdellovibrionota bacterium]
MVELTDVQKRAVEFILTHIESTGMPPTLREIAFHFQWKAVGSAQDVVAALRKKGVLLSPAPGKARQIVPAPEIFGGLFHPEQELLSMNVTQNKPHPKKITKYAPSLDKVLPGFEDFLRVPLLGQIQAGLPLEAIEQHREYTTFPAVSRSVLRGGSLFALTVEGYSMLNAGFLPGDLILVESAKTAHDREIVVASIHYSEVTVKRFAQKGSSLYRAAQNILKTQTLPPASAHTVSYSIP